jgi:RpiB/LacA/LacB family sugar-phosphate isomerase
MRIAIGSDHGGFRLKNALANHLRELGHEVLDLGTDSEGSVDYPDFADLVGRAVLDGKAERGIVLCGSGVGASIASNKIPGIYAAVCHDSYSARQGVEHDNMNVLCLGGRVIGEELGKVLVEQFVGARFVGNDPGKERHLIRVNKIKAIEKRGIS